MNRKQSKGRPSLFEALGSMAGITGILYALGYLAERAHLRMLGVSDIPMTAQKYLEAGGYFVWKSFLSLPFVLYSSTDFIISNWWSAIAIPLTMIMFILWKRSGWFNLHSRFLIFWKMGNTAKFILLILGYVVAFAFMLKVTLPRFVGPTKISRLLMESNPCSNDLHSNTADLTGDIVCCEASKLATYYAQLVLLLVLLINCMIFIQRYSSKFSNISKFDYPLRFVNLLFILLVGVHGVLLPLNYGVLLSSNRYSDVNIAFADNVNNPSRYLLLSQDGTSVGIYDPARHEVAIVQKANIQRITLIGEASIFTD